MGNVVNRVFDSSGPEGKVRGTPQQIIDKYTQLARDAQLGNDRVAAENFQQHAEHYTRLLGEAMREQEARREAHEAQQQAQRNRQRENEGGDSDGRSDPGSAPQPDSGIMDVAGDNGPGLVETPEEKSPEPRPRRQRKPRPERPTADDDSDQPQTAAE